MVNSGDEEEDTSSREPSFKSKFRTVSQESKRRATSDQNIDNIKTSPVEIATPKESANARHSTGTVQFSVSEPRHNLTDLIVSQEI
jgi:hypothetical protein